MKRSVLLLLFTLLFSLADLSAQSSVRLGVNTYNKVLRDLVQNKGTLSPYALGSLIDKPGPKTGPGSVIVGYQYATSEYYTLAFDFMYSPMFRTMERDGKTVKNSQYISSEAYSFLVGIQGNYINKPAFRMYGYLGVSISWSKHIALINTQVPFLFFQATPVGISVGRRLRAFAELGYGAGFCGAQCGVSYGFN